MDRAELRVLAPIPPRSDSLKVDCDSVRNNSSLNRVGNVSGKALSGCVVTIANTMNL